MSTNARTKRESFLVHIVRGLYPRGAVSQTQHKYQNWHLYFQCFFSLQIQFSALINFWKLQGGRLLWTHNWKNLNVVQYLNEKQQVLKLNGIYLFKKNWFYIKKTWKEKILQRFCRLLQNQYAEKRRDPFVLRRIGFGGK